jgi:hypothetical protein
MRYLRPPAVTKLLSRAFLVGIFTAALVATYARGHTVTEYFGDGDNCNPNVQTPAGHQHRDEFHMRDGNDCAWMHEGPDLLYLGGGRDCGPDSGCHGGAGNDDIYGGGGLDDTVEGQADNDYIDGEDDSDYIVGGSGIDTLKGGGGAHDSVLAADGNAGDTANGGSGGDDQCAIDHAGGVDLDYTDGCELIIRE